MIDALAAALSRNWGFRHEVSFSMGEVITVLDKSGAFDGWWHGAVGEKTGWFPASYVEGRTGGSFPPFFFVLEAGRRGKEAFLCCAFRGLRTGLRVSAWAIHPALS